MRGIPGVSVEDNVWQQCMKSRRPQTAVRLSALELEEAIMSETTVKVAADKGRKADAGETLQAPVEGRRSVAVVVAGRVYCVSSLKELAAEAAADRER